MGVDLPEAGSSCIVVVPIAVVCTAATAGEPFVSVRFLPDLGMADRSKVDEIADSDGVSSAAGTVSCDEGVRSWALVGVSIVASRFRNSSTGLSTAPRLLRLAIDVRRLALSPKSGLRRLRSALASTPTVRGLMKTVCGVTPRSVSDTDLVVTNELRADSDVS